MHGFIGRLATDVGTISLTNLNARIALVIILILCVLFAARAITHHHLRHWVIISFAASIVVAFMCWAILEVWWVPFTDHMPYWLYLWVAGTAFLIFSAFVQRGRRIKLSIIALIGAVTMLGSINFLYNQYPDLQALSKDTMDGYSSYEDFYKDYENSTSAPAQGTVFTMSIGSEKSHFHHRDAIVYVPPAYYSDKNFDFPVFVMMHGNPGGPDMWFGGGNIGGIMDDYAARHNGYAPIIVSIDATGSVLGNPICMDTNKWNVMTYIAEDVPTSIKERLNVDQDQSHWVIGGLSYGGTCSLQVATNHPEAYGTFLDLSGQAEPTIGTHRQTVNTFFGGDESRFAAQNPADILKSAAGTDRFAGIEGVFVAGKDDPESVEALATLNSLAQGAGMKTQYQVVPGAHDWNTWRAGLVNNLDYLVDRTHMVEKIHP
ncbi:MAG: alpha/beta hydrolase-fold protein [Corynebacterium sp.]|nr:alpha/beta hydrolase-fold protein [Corynebacterium sp.]